VITRWEHLTWVDLEKRISDATAIVVFGSVEQHGKHLPLGTDTIIPIGILDRLVIKYANNPIVKNLIMLPPVALTIARNSSWLSGTVNLKGMTLISFTEDLMSELFRQGIKRVLVFNGHMESRAFVEEGIHLAVDRRHGVTVLFINWWEFVSNELIEEMFGSNWPGWEAEHAALTETSLMMDFAPELVKREKAAFSPEFKHLPYSVFPQPYEVRPPTGAYAEMAAASADIGAKLADHIIDKVMDVLEKRFPI